MDEKVLKNYRSNSDYTEDKSRRNGSDESNKILFSRTCAGAPRKIAVSTTSQDTNYKNLEAYASETQNPSVVNYRDGRSNYNYRIDFGENSFHGSGEFLPGDEPPIRNCVVVSNVSEAPACAETDNSMFHLSTKGGRV